MECSTPLQQIPLFTGCNNASVDTLTHPSATLSNKKFVVQAIMVVNTIFLASLSMLTLPLYSITVQMGGDFKAHLLPDDIVQNTIRVQSIKVHPHSPFLQFLWGALQHPPAF